MKYFLMLQFFFQALVLPGFSQNKDSEKKEPTKVQVKGFEFDQKKYPRVKSSKQPVPIRVAPKSTRPILHISNIDHLMINTLTEYINTVILNHHRTFPANSDLEEFLKGKYKKIRDSRINNVSSKISINAYLNIKSPTYPGSLSVLTKTNSNDQNYNKRIDLNTPGYIKGRFWIGKLAIPEQCLRQISTSDIDIHCIDETSPYPYSKQVLLLFNNLTPKLIELNDIQFELSLEIIRSEYGAIGSKEVILFKQQDWIIKPIPLLEDMYSAKWIDQEDFQNLDLKVEFVGQSGNRIKDLTAIHSFLDKESLELKSSSKKSVSKNISSNPIWFEEIAFFIPGWGIHFPKNYYIEQNRKNISLSKIAFGNNNQALINLPQSEISLKIPILKNIEVPKPITLNLSLPNSVKIERIDSERVIEIRVLDKNNHKLIDTIRHMITESSFSGMRTASKSHVVSSVWQKPIALNYKGYKRKTIVINQDSPDIIETRLTPFHIESKLRPIPPVLGAPISALSDYMVDAYLKDNPQRILLVIDTSSSMSQTIENAIELAKNKIEDLQKDCNNCEISLIPMSVRFDPPRIRKKFSELSKQVDQFYASFLRSYSHISKPYDQVHLITDLVEADNKKIFTEHFLRSFSSLIADNKIYTWVFGDDQTYNGIKNEFQTFNEDIENINCRQLYLQELVRGNIPLSRAYGTFSSAYMAPDLSELFKSYNCFQGVFNESGERRHNELAYENGIVVLLFYQSLRAVYLNNDQTDRINYFIKETGL